MAVSVDSVYQKVLALANKEQRGYITPQEFNLFADQAQMEIFEQYFYDVDQFERRVGDDAAALTKRKIEIFRTFAAPILPDNPPDNTAMTLPNDVYIVESVYLDIYNGSDVVEKQSIVEKMDRDESYNISAAINNSPLTKPNISRPVYAIHQNIISVSPPPSQNPPRFYYMNYIKTPEKPSWGYIVVNDKPLYNSTVSTDFELHISEESELVYRILAYVGVAIEKPQLTQTAMGLEGAKVQQEKQ